MTKPTAKQIKALTEVSGFPRPTRLRSASPIRSARPLKASRPWPGPCRSISSPRPSSPFRIRRLPNECHRTRIAVADGRRRRDRDEEGFVARSHAVLPRSRREVAAEPQRLYVDRGRCSAEGGRRGRCVARQGAEPRRTARRAAGAQGHVLRRGTRRDLRLAYSPRLGCDHDGNVTAAPEGCRHGAARFVADG
jgi:hypothetical protein